jgi:tRNA(Met) C34 N-acetyltransferase TmcA
MKQKQTNKKTIERINETKSWFFVKINKIDRSLENLAKMRKENTQISIIRNAKEQITTNTTEIQEILGTTLRTYILLNLKILKKWTVF